MSKFTILCFLKVAECTLKSYQTVKLFCCTNVELSLNERMFFLRVNFYVNDSQ